MKKIGIVLAIIGLAIVGSACSLIPGSAAPKAEPKKADGGIFKSVDYGDHWLAVNTVSATEKLPASTLANTELVFLKFHPVTKDIIYLSASGKGIYKSTDDGETWAPTTLTSATFPSLTIDARNINVFYVIKGNTILKSIDNMATWFTTYVETRPGQKLVDIIVDPARPNTVYAASTTSVLKSTNYGNDWNLTNWKQPTITRLYQNTVNPDILYAITNKGIFKTTDGAVTWQDLAETLSAYTGASTIYWSSYDSKADTMVISTKYGVLRTTDGGAIWQEIFTLFEHKKITVKPVVFNQNTTSTVLMAINNVIQKTYDLGVTWSSLKSIPTTRKIHYLINDPNHPDTVFAGTMVPKQ